MFVDEEVMMHSLGILLIPLNSVQFVMGIPSTGYSHYKKTVSCKILAKTSFHVFVDVHLHRVAQDMQNPSKILPDMRMLATRHLSGHWPTSYQNLAKWLPHERHACTGNHVGNFFIRSICDMSDDVASDVANFIRVP